MLHGLNSWKYTAGATATVEREAGLMFIGTGKMRKQIGFMK